MIHIGLCYLRVFFHNDVGGFGLLKMTMTRLSWCSCLSWTLKNSTIWIGMEDHLSCWLASSTVSRLFKSCLNTVPSTRLMYIKLISMNDPRSCMPVQAMLTKWFYTCCKTTSSLVSKPILWMLMDGTVFFVDLAIVVGMMSNDDDDCLLVAILSAISWSSTARQL